MQRTLIAYYSRTGHTQKVADRIAAACGADVEIVPDKRSRTGVLGYLRASLEAISGSRTLIGQPEKDPKQYDLVILGTPIWFMSLTPAMRTYIATHAAGFRRVAFFCTEGGSGDARAFRQMAALCDLEPVATLVVTEAEVKTKTFDTKLAAFVKNFDHEGADDARPNTNTSA